MFTAILGLKDLFPPDKNDEHIECREEERKLRQDLELCRKQLLTAKLPATTNTNFVDLLMPDLHTSYQFILPNHR
ncbi:hypothetical protein PR048_009426 [Dryococelus australis]|uniref:Uncharacterized protein n=1 Tax=Dryococelus australis TaxID=614101 RepID=A0ABQ9HZU6_9NEOP|nr:hypothetical protein PR048_009426 [Dryococelus australis]